jgi:competence protein ComGC
MKSSSNKRAGSAYAGFTIIEAVLYIALLSGILVVIIPYISATNEQNLKLIDRIGSQD